MKTAREESTIPQGPAATGAKASWQTLAPGVEIWAAAWTSAARALLACGLHRRLPFLAEVTIRLGAKPRLGRIASQAKFR